MSTECYTVRVKRPPGVSVQEMREYIKYSIKNYGGGFHPEHALFNGVDASVTRNTKDEPRG